MSKINYHDLLHRQELRLFLTDDEISLPVTQQEEILLERKRRISEISRRHGVLGNHELNDADIGESVLARIRDWFSTLRKLPE
jgi:hypothetical protein